MDIRKEAGNFVEALGMLIAPGAKDTGISEWIAGGPTTYTQAKANTTGETGTPTFYNDAGQVATSQPTQGGVSGSWESAQPTQQTSDNGGNTSGGGGSSGGDSLLEYLSKVNRNPVQETQYQEQLALQNRSKVDNAAVDAAYKTLMESYGMQEKSARTGAETGSANVEARNKNEVEKVNAELEKMLRDLGISQKSMRQENEDILDRNVSAYNALEQRANVRYGGGSSSGDLMRELAAKELYKQQGLTRREGQSANVHFETQMQDAKLFISQKISDLALYKQEALDDISNNLSKSLAEITTRRGQSDIAKAEAKMGLLQQAREEAANITTQDQTLRNELFGAYIANIQELQGKILTPQEVQTLYYDFADINFKSQGQGLDQAMAYNPTRFNDEEDELSQLKV